MFSFAPWKKRFSLGSSQNRVDLPSVEIQDIETSTDRRARTLKHLLKANHANHSIIYHNLEYNNHMPHILGSAYLLGAEQDHLNDIYDNESKELEAWTDAPGEITLDDWREFLGKRHYQRAYVDFFEDQLVRFGYDWEELIRHFLFDGSEPLVNNLIASCTSSMHSLLTLCSPSLVGHPLIHIGYAFELHSQTLAIESLAMACCSYNYLHKYVDQTADLSSSGQSSRSILEILDEVRKDKRFDGLFSHAGSADLEKLFTQREAAVLEHWSSWKITNPKQQFEDTQVAAAALLVGSGDNKADGNAGQYDFFLVHVLTSSHAVRTLLPLIPSEFHSALLRQWWLLALAVYIVQGRPKIDTSRITDIDVSSKSWKSIEHVALTGKHSLDSHYVKGIRALKTASQTWTDEQQMFLKSAVKFSEDFTRWGGFN